MFHLSSSSVFSSGRSRPIKKLHGQAAQEISLCCSVDDDPLFSQHSGSPAFSEMLCILVAQKEGAAFPHQWP